MSRKKSSLFKLLKTKLGGGGVSSVKNADKKNREDTNSEEKQEESEDHNWNQLELLLQGPEGVTRQELMETELAHELTVAFNLYSKVVCMSIMG